MIAEWSPVGNLDIIGVGVSPCRGLRKGVVVNIDSTVESLKHAVSEAEEMAGVEIASAEASASSTTSWTWSPARLTLRMTLRTDVVAPVTRCTSTSSRTPDMPRGSLMPSWSSTT